MYIKSFINIL